MKGKNVLTISSQVMPYLSDTYVSRMAYQIPKAINSLGGQIRIFMPRFGVINERRHQLHEVIRLSGINLVIDDTDMPLVIKVASIPKDRIQVYFIDNDDYFKRKAVLENDKGEFFEDNDERIMFFVKGVVETIKKLNWVPDIIHLHGWVSSLLPLYIKKLYAKEPLFRGSKVVTSIYDDSFEGSLDLRMYDKLQQDGFASKDINLLKDPNYANLIKMAIEYSDALVFASATLSEPIEKYALDSGLEVLNYTSGDNAHEVCVEFFRKLLNS